MIRGAVIAAFALLLAGCDQAAADVTPDADIKRIEIERMTFGEGVTIIHDDRHDVTCWVNQSRVGNGISCLPDWMLTGPRPAVKP
ncbi:hypothetical protein D3C81_1227460 [compost metagenome]